MSDIMERLRGLADLFEAGDAPRHVVLHMRAAADEIERLRDRLEIDPSHPYDGIYARDETIRGLEKQIANLLNLLADARTESMKLRAALEPLACTCDRANGAVCSRAEVNCAFWQARAALAKQSTTEEERA